jgi:hypothetical protein
MNDTLLEQSTRRSNLLNEREINLQRLKGGIPRRPRFNHPNSVAAFRKLSPDTKHYDIMRLYGPGSKYTDRQVKDLLRKDDMNEVRPRLSELIDFGLLRVCKEKVEDYKTKMMVRQTELNEAQGTLF